MTGGRAVRTSILTKGEQHDWRESGSESILTKGERHDWLENGSDEYSDER